VDALAKTIVENSGHASNASTIARKAREVAEQGKLVMHKMVDAMNEIAKVVNNSAETVSLLGRSSDQIGEITGVIDDIADQTNLLALNAAIEAARAGEQGRGFAVVADEVRKLAERTTTATKEIATMIQRIQEETRGAVQVMHEGNKRVSGGIELADRAGASLQEIVATSQEVTDTVTQIAAASEQQSSASEEISKNIAAISHVSHETAAGTQQLARAADDLNRLTETLQSALSRFKLSANTQSAARNGIVPEMSRVAVRASGMLVPSEG
jgi:methyl-accepting chemotaxis protein